MNPSETFSIQVKVNSKTLEKPYSLTNFRVDLGKTIKLNSNYKAALALAHLPKSFYNTKRFKLNWVVLSPLPESVVRKNDHEFKQFSDAHYNKLKVQLRAHLHVDTTKDISYCKYNKEQQIGISIVPAKQLTSASQTSDIYWPGGFYPNESELIKDLNKLVELASYSMNGESKTKIDAHISHFHVNARKGYVSLTAGEMTSSGSHAKHYVYPVLAPDVASCLGLGDMFSFAMPDEILSDIPEYLLKNVAKIYSETIGISNKHNFLNISSSLVKPTLYNNKVLNILQSVPIPKSSNFGDVIIYEPYNLNYVDVALTEFNSLDFILTVDDFHKIDLFSGEVSLLIFFKKF